MSTHSLKVHSFPWGIGGVLSLSLIVMMGFYEVHIGFERSSSSYVKRKSSFLVCFSLVGYRLLDGTNWVGKFLTQLKKEVDY